MADYDKGGDRPATGAGYGGPAKGFVRNTNRKKDFGSKTNAQGHSVATPAPFNRAEVRRQRQDAVEEHMFNLALGAELERDQISAGKAFMVERKEVMGADGGPLQIVYSWADEVQE